MPVVACVRHRGSADRIGADPHHKFVYEVFFLRPREVDRNHVLLLAIENIDLFLLASVVHGVSLGLSQLYFRPDLHLPSG